MGTHRIGTALGILGALVLAALIAAAGAVSVLAVANASGATGHRDYTTVTTVDTAQASSDAVAGADSPLTTAGGPSATLSPSGLPRPSSTSAPGTSAPGTSAPAGRASAPGASRSSLSRRSTAGPTPTASRPVPVTPRTKAPAGTGNAEQQVLTQINAVRAIAGVGPLTMSSALVASAHAHNLVMAAGCGLSHQCGGEAELGDRISAQGVEWSGVAENIGRGGPVATNANAQAGMAVGLTASMLAEAPPNDGHRQNILNGDMHRIGIDVVRDSSGIIWLTQDFAS